MKILCAFFFLFLSFWAQAQPSFDRITIVDANIFPTDAVVDASGNTYVIGTFAGDPDFDPGMGVVNAPDAGNWKTEDNYNDAFIAKYNSDGTLAWVQAMWTRGATGADNDPFLFLRDVVLDDAGNVFFVGDLRGSADGIGNQVSGTSTIQGGDSPRAFARGLSPTGSIVFQGVNSHVNLSAGSTGHGIDVDASGNVFITGEFDFDVNGFPVANSSNKQTYYAKFDNTGSRTDDGYLINSATSTYDVNRDNGGRAIEVQDDGSFFITGYFGQNAAFDGSTTLSSVNQKDTYVAYYNSSETLLDVKTFSTAEEGRQVELDGSGNLYLSYGTNITRITNTGTTDWTRDFGYDVSFSINSANELLVSRLNGELRFLKLLSDNSIDFEIAVPFVAGVASSLSAIKAIEFTADNYKWILDDIQDSNFDGSAPTENGSGIIVADYFVQTDFSPPAITTRTPGLDATNVPLDQSFTVEFDEDIVLETGQAIVSIAPTAGGGITNLFEGNPGLSSSGNTLTFSTSNLVASTNYQITLYNIQDVLGNEIQTTNGWFITTGSGSSDNTAPTISSRTPIDDATDVPLDQTFSVTFDEPIVLEPGQFVVNLFKDGSIFSQFLEGNNNISANNSTLTFNLPGLSNDGSYGIQILNIQDAAGNEITATNQADWSFTTASEDITPPQIVSLNPADDATDVPVDASFVATFDEPITIPSGISQAIILYRDGGPQIIIPSGDERINITDNVLTINFNNILLPSTNYSIWIRNSVSDLNGNFNSTFNNSTTWNFTTRTPIVNIPDDNFKANLVNQWDANQDGEIQVSEAEAASNVTAMNLDITDATGLEAFINITSLNLSGNTNLTSIDLSPLVDLTHVTLSNTTITNVDLSSNTQLVSFQMRDTPLNNLNVSQNNLGTLTIPNGNVASLDVAHMSNLNILNVLGNPLSTLDISANNSVQYLYLGSHNQNFSATGLDDLDLISFSFVNSGLTSIDLSIYPNLGDLELYGNSLTELDLSGLSQLFYMDLRDNDLQSLNVANGNNVNMGASDLYITGNPNLTCVEVDDVTYTSSNWTNKDGQTSYSLDCAPPEIVSITPVSGSIIQNTNPQFEIVFSENIETSDTDDKILVYQYNTENSWWDIGDPNSVISIQGNTIITELSRGANPGVRYYIRFESNGIQDAAGNFMAPITDKNFYNFYGNRNPFGILLSSNSIVENNSVGDVIGTLETEDGDAQTHVYELVSGTGDTDNASFSISGNQLIANEVFDFEQQQTYSIRISTSDGTASFEEEFTIQIETSDNQAPIANSTSPSDEGTFAPLSAGGGIVFNEAVQQASGSIELYLSDGTLVESIPTGVNDSRLGQPADFRITWDFNTDLIPSTGYYILVSEGAYEDFAGNPFAGLGIGDLDFTSNSRPEIETLTPSNEATDVAVDASITFDLNENVEASGTLSLVIREYNSDALFESFDLITLDLGVGAGSFLNGTIIVSPSQDFASNTKYYILLEGSGSLSSVSNAEAFIGLNDKNDWTFTTATGEDTAPPQIVSLSPAVEATGVSLSTNLVLSFNETVQLAENGSIAIFDRTTQEREGQNWFVPAFATVDGSTVTIDLPENLSPGKEYYVEMRNAIEDLAGNNFPDLTGPEEWYFITEGEAQPPVIISRIPAVGATEVDVNADLLLSFDEEVQSTASGTLKIFERTTGNQVGSNWFFPSTATFNGTEVTVDIPITLAPETEYYVEILNAIQDVWGNVLPDMTGESDWNFTTGPIDGPEIISLSPSDNATDVALNQAFTVTFDEPVQFTQFGFIRIKNSDGSTHTNIAFKQSSVDAGWLTVDGNSVTFFRQAFEYASEYYITFDDGVFEDLDGNPLTGYSDDPEFWNFTTVEADGPELISVSPADDSIIDPQARVLTMTFDEPIVLTNSGRISVLTADGAGFVNAVLSESDPRISVDGSTLTVDFSTPVWTPGNYYVTVSATIEDLDAIAFEGISDPSAWNFTVSDPSKSSQTITFPAIDDITFGESVTLAATASSALDVTYEITEGNDLVNQQDNVLTATGIGMVTVQALQEGDETFDQATPVSRSFTIAKAEQIISFEEPAPVTFGDSNVTLSATGGDSGNEVVFESLDETIATVSGNQVTILVAGTVEISATQAGNEFYEPAMPVVQTLVVNKADQEITITPVGDKLTTNNPFEVIATVNSELPLTYSVSGPASNDNSLITLSGDPGQVTITASQEGNINYNPSTASISFEVTSPEPVLSLDENVVVEFYPNPVSDLLHVRLKEPATISVLNLNGQVLIQQNTSYGTFDLSSLSAGTYLLEVKSENRTMRERLIKVN